MKRRLVALLGTLALGFGGLYAVDGAAAFQARTYRLPPLSPPLGLVFVAASAAYWVLPALRLRVLGAVQGQALPLSTGLLVHLAGLFSAAVTPGGSGSAPAIAAGLRRAGLPLGTAVAMAVQVTVLDLLFFVWALPLSLAYLAVSNAPALSGDVIAVALTCTVAALAASTVLGRSPRPIVRLLLWLARRPSLSRFRQRLTAVARGYYRSSRLFVTMRWTTWCSLHALGALSWLGMFVLFWALARAVQPLEALTTIASLTIATLVAFVVPTPGGAGFIEVAVGYGVGSFVPQTDLVAPLLLWRVATFYLVFLLGPVASWLLFTDAFGWRTGGPGRASCERGVRDDD